MCYHGLQVPTEIGIMSYMGLSIPIVMGDLL